ncbi:hypothetical protein E3N88_22127 [Mikania micrantha]|uniref:Uncharacterized protein n=1 Tax=Mikania micrantha TaxID=192012 RepID=A0A5N6N9H4_9ASTR|nr:hypothetical protein E3N88_22127 [Mikania micrantha]
MIIGDNGSYFDSTQYSGIMATVVCFVQVCYTITCGISVMFEDECFKGSFSLDLDIDVEDEVHKDFLRANHIVRYHELSFKTWFYFSTVAARWDADLYIKVDDDFLRQEPGTSEEIQETVCTRFKAGLTASWDSSNGESKLVVLCLPFMNIGIVGIPSN